MADLYDGTKDRYQLYADPVPHAQARHALAVAPSDTLDCTNAAGDGALSYYKALYIGTTGNVAIIAAGDNSNNGAGTSVTFQNVPVGWFPVQVRRVMSTGTTASNIVGLYD